MIPVVPTRTGIYDTNLYDASAVNRYEYGKNRYLQDNATHLRRSGGAAPGAVTGTLSCESPVPSHQQQNPHQYQQLASGYRYVCVIMQHCEWTRQAGRQASS